MKKIYIILYVLILLAIPVYATRYFSHQFKDDITIICPECNYYIFCNSSSMYPTFSCNDALIGIEPNSKKDIEIGDIIWYKGKEGDIVHRIKGIDYKGCYVTKGDNNQEEDVFTPCFYDIKFKIAGVIYG
jgi:signal peptidase I